MQEFRTGERHWHVIKVSGDPKQCAPPGWSQSRSAPASCELLPLPSSAPNFFPGKALRKRTSVRSLGRLPACRPRSGFVPPSPPTISPWRLPSHVALWFSLASLLQDPDLTPSPPPFLPSPVPLGTTPRCRELGHQLCLRGTSCFVFSTYKLRFHPTTVSILFIA